MAGDALISVAWVRDNIKRETGVADSKAGENAEHLFNTLHASLRQPLADWWKTGKFDPTLSAQGWTIDKLIDGGVTNCVYGAFTWLSGLITAPEETLKLLEVTIRHCSHFFQSTRQWPRK